MAVSEGRTTLIQVRRLEGVKKTPCSDKANRMSGRNEPSFLSLVFSVVVLELPQAF